MKSTKHPWLNWLWHTLLIAAAYALMGRMALWLAIPPGYASPVWPAAGVALFAVLQWGYGMGPAIVLGSFLVNVWTSMETETNIKYLLPLGIGIGAAAEAMLGAFLIRKWVGFPTSMLRVHEIGKFLLLGGPIACLVNATWGPACLSWAEVNPWQNYPINAGYWWIGDTIGVLTMAPLLLVAFSRPRDVWHARWKTVSIPLICAFIMVVTLFVYARDWERDRIGREFERRAASIANGLTEDISRYSEVLESIGSFYDSSREVQRDEFQTFVQSALERYPGIAALSWNRYVTADEREAIERELTDSGLGVNFITEPDAQRNMVRAKERDEYVVVTYLEPLEGNRSALGFDIASDALRRETIERALQIDSLAMTPRIRLVQEQVTHSQYGVLALLPIYHRNMPTETLRDRKTSLHGFAVEVFRLGDMVRESLRGIEMEGLNLRLHDATASEGERILVALADGENLDPFDPALESEILHHPLKLGWQSLHPIADRLWHLNVIPTLDYLRGQQTWHVWFVIASGLLFTSLLGVFLLAMTGSHVIDLERAEELRHQNEVMEQFIYTVSHDLKSPVLTLNGFTQLAKNAIEKNDWKDAQFSLSRIALASHRMHQLIEDLLELSRIGRVMLEAEIIDTHQLLEDLKAIHELEWKQKHAVVEIQAVMPKIEMERTRFTQVMQNLFSNAIQHGCTAPQPCIQMEARVDQSEVCFFVKDNGQGISPAHHQRIFGLFKRLRTETEGTGVGLAIVYRIMKEYDGRCWVESQPGAGTAFWVAFPIAILRP